MKSWRTGIFAISLLFLSACTSMPGGACAAEGCQATDAYNPQLNVWWSPALRDGGGEYSKVFLND